MEKITLKQVADAVCRAHGYCDYYRQTNQTIGPHDVRELRGPTTGRYYDQRRAWDTEIAVALAEKEFDVVVSHYEIVNRGPWRDTVESIHAAISNEFLAEAEYARKIA